MKKDNSEKQGQIVFLFSMIFSILFILYVSFLQPGISIDEIQENDSPATKEQGPAVSSFDPKSVKEPWNSTEALVNYGKSVYKTNCAVCHGATGLGDGPASQGINPRNFVKGDWKQGGSSKQLFTTITKGVPGTSMAAFPQISVVDRWALVHFIRGITKNKVKDDLKKLKTFAETAK